MAAKGDKEKTKRKKEVKMRTHMIHNGNAPFLLDSIRVYQFIRALRIRVCEHFCPRQAKMVNEHLEEYV